uniref:Uncharacterized protein n=1 Tax=Fusarium oxysporum (strain Fo5176) TaxID=660025 RepID=A0A0D2YEN1_FUSOF
MVTQEKKDKLGYIVAYQEMLLWFVRTAREGIRRHGASLGDYYRHRYPNFRSWVEYAVLLQDLPQMDSSQIVSRIRKSLELKFNSAHGCPPQDHAIVSHVRHVLVRISGRSNRAQLELLGTHVESIDLSLTFRYLIGGCKTVREHCHIDELVQQVSSAQLFCGSMVDLNFIQDRFTKLSLEVSLTTRVSPNTLYPSSA